MNTILKYDGSFEGMLCCIFYIYEASLKEVDIQKNELATHNFFDPFIEIISEPNKATRVWKSIQSQGSKGMPKLVYKAFLSEQVGVENKLLHLVRRLFNKEKYPEKDYSDPLILNLANIVKKVDREKHRMDAFIRFRLTKDGVYMATIAPDFNVLPLNMLHFEKRYADQKWLIYDLKRKYGVYYDLRKVTPVTLELDSKLETSTHESLFFTSEELKFQELWKHYFRSTNIKERKNMKLHIRHVPKRYWQHMSEITDH